MASPWQRLRRIEPRTWDAILALGLCAVSVSVLVVSPPSEPNATRASDALGFALIAVGYLPLIRRRRHPLPVALIVSGACIAYAALGYPGDLATALVVASYTVAAYEERERVAAIALPFAVAAAVVIAFPDGHNWAEAVVEITFGVGVPMSLGRVVFNRRRRITLDRERAARDAVLAERARIARELHDVVAHAMSVMVIQAGAARTVVRRDPDEAIAALRRIEETGRTGLEEMRRLIGVLKDDEDDPVLAPQPGLGQLDALITTVREAGLSVETLIEGTPRALPPGIDLTAYRVIQEALTNAIKHAGDDVHARVVTRYAPDGLDIEVADDGRGPGPGLASSGGHGLIGMRERIGMFDGALDVAARAGGGFVVRAHIPLAMSELAGI